MKNMQIIFTKKPRKDKHITRYAGMNMNRITLTGRLTEEPKVTYSAGAEPVARASFNFAVPDMSMKRDEDGNYPTDFFRCTCWNKLAEIVEKHCNKGTKLLINGRLKNNNYEKDGQKVYSNEIVIDSLEFLEARAAKIQDAQPQEASAAEPTAETEPARTEPPSNAVN